MPTLDPPSWFDQLRLVVALWALVNTVWLLLRNAHYWSRMPESIKSGLVVIMFFAITSTVGAGLLYRAEAVTTWAIALGLGCQLALSVHLARFSGRMNAMYPKDGSRGGDLS